jgi:glycosyltransferase involved in cell wall biosynthesis
MPTYNDAHFLSDALNNILQQTWEDFELIVVNDGSKDNTREILDDYARRYPITVIHQQNSKLPGALNTGFKRARGDYLTWTSTDNFMHPDMLKTLVKALDDNPDVGLVYADWEIIDEQGNVQGRISTLEHDPLLLRRVNYVQACFLYRRECQEQVGLYDPEYHLAEDWEYWWRISQSFSMMRVPLLLYQYRIHSGSLTHFVQTRQGGVSTGYKKLAANFQADPIAWYWSKVKYELLKSRLGGEPLQLQPYSSTKGS